MAALGRNIDSHTNQWLPPDVHKPGSAPATLTSITYTSSNGIMVSWHDARMAMLLWLKW